MNKRHNILIVISTLLIIVLGAAFLNVSQADLASPAEAVTFSYVVEFTGDVEEDLHLFAQMLQDQGFSEAEIQNNLDHLRPNLETSTYNPSEKLAFSVEVECGDIDGFVLALREQGVSEETIRNLENEISNNWRKFSGNELDSRGCKTRIDGAEMKNLYGMLLYSYSSSIYWCYSGSTITTLDTWESYSTYLGWQFIGSSKNQSGGLGQWSYILHRYATFYNPFLSLYGYPDTHQGVYGDGSSWGYASP